MKTFVVLLYICFTSLCRADIVVTDDTGAEIRLRQPAQRVIALAPHIAETLFAAGAGDRLVGTVDYSDYPEAAKKIPHVGSYVRIDMEAVLALKPDLVIGWQSGNSPAHLEKLKQLGFPVFITQPNHIEDVARDLDRYGQLLGSTEGARAAAAFRARLAKLRERHAGRPTVRVFYQVWKDPLTTIAGKQIIGDVIRLCGGENVFASLDQMAPSVSVEAVLAADPEAIVASGMGDARPEWLDDWKRWPQLTAVARDNLFFVPPQLIQRQTPRLLDGAERLCQQLDRARAHLKR